MKTQITILLAMFAIVHLSFAQQSLPHIPKERPADFEYLSAPDSLGNRTIIKTPSSINSERIETLPQKLPYPIIFIHGLNSWGDTWNTTTNFMDAQYGFTFGGRFDYCLNYDGDLYNANTNFYPTVGADIAVFSGTWVRGDYYYINFDVGTDGSFNPTQYYVLSEQSAIVKQGIALSDAIYRVLQITGRDKVILMGHSMGGLASRQYLQNPSIWQPDGQSHVAKLVTTGTPHGGSNAYAPQFFTGVNDRSDAVRDLKTSYAYSLDPGVYLDGGIESNSVMDDFFSGYFYNVDVNCNGTIGQNIVGLNQRSLYTNLGYSCIIGECTSCPSGEELPGDGIVNDIKANLNNYYTGLNADIFHYNAGAVFQIHTDLPSQIFQNMQGLDESDKYNLAYHIGFDTTYMGFITVQDTHNVNYPTDYDLYKFTVPSQTDVTVNISNITLPDLYVNFIDASYNVVGSTIHSNNSTTMNHTETLNAGDYYLNIYGIETPTHVDPYKFKLSHTTTSITGNSFVNKISIYPNPNNGNFTLSYSISSPKGEFQIHDMTGRVVYNYSIINSKGSQNIDASSLSNGVYFYTIKMGDIVETQKLVIAK